MYDIESPRALCFHHGPCCGMRQHMPSGGLSVPAPPAVRRRAETHSEIQPSATTLSLSPMPTALAAALTGQKQTHFLAKASMSFCNAVRNPTPRIAPRHNPMPISVDTPFAAFSFAAAGARPADAGAHTLIQLAASTAIRSRARTISAARHAPGPRLRESGLGDVGRTRGRAACFAGWRAHASIRAHAL